MGLNRFEFHKPLRIESLALGRSTDRRTAENFCLTLFLMRRKRSRDWRRRLVSTGSRPELTYVFVPLQPLWFRGLDDHGWKCAAVRETVVTSAVDRAISSLALRATLLPPRSISEALSGEMGRETRSKVRRLFFGETAFTSVLRRLSGLIESRPRRRQPRHLKALTRHQRAALVSSPPAQLMTTRVLSLFERPLTRDTQAPNRSPGFLGRTVLLTG